jgi:hypothetical protein
VGRRVAAAAALVVLAAGGAAGQSSMPVPPRHQMAIFKRVFQYDRTLAGRGPVRVLVVHDGGNGLGDVHDLLASFEWAGIEAAPVHYSQLATRIEGTAVAYVLPGVPPAAYLDRFAERAVLSISGVPALAQRGNVSIALGTRGDGKPEIIVHLGRLKTEKHDISAELLKVARIIQ